MSDTQEGAAAAPEADVERLPQAPLTVKAQYTKDLSFENPGAPTKNLSALRSPPQVHVNVSVDTSPLEGRDWEVTLEIKATAKDGEDTLFLAELVYGGVFEVAEGVVEDHVRPMLLIECPRILFPFAREILANATRDGGLPPLMLQPIDFGQLYRQRFAEEQPAAGHA